MNTSRAGYVGTFLELLNPVPQLSKDPERLLTEEQRSFLETTAGKVLPVVRRSFYVLMIMFQILAMRTWFGKEQ